VRFTLFIALGLSTLAVIAASIVYIAYPKQRSGDANAWPLAHLQATADLPALFFRYPASFGVPEYTISQSEETVRFNLADVTTDTLSIVISASQLDGNQSLSDFVDNKDVALEDSSRIKYQVVGSRYPTIASAASVHSGLTFYDVYFGNGKVLQMLFGRASLYRSSTTTVSDFRKIEDQIISTLIIDNGNSAK